MDKGKIILYGHSLGGAVALQLAVDNPQKVAAVIVENTFLRLARVALSNGFLSGLLEPFITERWDNERLLKSRINELGRQGQKVPHILFLVGMKDTMVPCWHSERLWELVEAVPWAGSVVRMIHKFVDGPHTCHSQPGYHAKIKDFLSKAFDDQSHL